ncbi:carbohydrate ABC transporter permease [Breznakiella homolactica]|uniref:Sugar ABC transporter permease n=1 Tax=Breznakiella homolactica TaxID=2798577 RepID=A0A7T8BAS9_9SPIR|nr:sugar ABC transporter permease [Breznakiella homolactica]QQO08478.1 sugar ABC transporter permease [Breznakiella homolactica]
MRVQKNIAYYSFLIIPAATVLIFITVVIIPFIIGIGYSFFTWDGIPANPKIWNGIGNYIRIFSDARFWRSGMHTLVFTFFSVLSTNLLGLLLALVVTTNLRTRNAARAMFFAPYLIGGLLLGFIWKFVFARPFPAIGELLGLEKIFFNWLLQPASAMAALVIVNTWKMAGYIMIIYIAGLQGIPMDLLEAASVDGATGWQRFRSITVPLLMPAITVTTFMTLSNSFKIYDVNLSLTAGGPFSSTEMFAINIYNEIFTIGNYGYGQAKAIVFFVFVAVITLVQTYFNKRREVVM